MHNVLAIILVDADSVQTSEGLNDNVSVIAATEYSTKEDDEGKHLYITNYSMEYWVPIECIEQIIPIDAIVDEFSDEPEKFIDL